MQDLPVVHIPDRIPPCDACHRADRANPSRRAVSLQDLFGSAESGCAICRLRYMAIYKDMPQERTDVVQVLKFEGPAWDETFAVGQAVIYPTDVALPTRVLDIGGGCGDPVRLIEVAPGQSGRYTALSHCWGGGIDIRTTTGNYTAQQQGLRYCDLPLSFRDAITVTRGLGLRYLWIDALCIIQDCQTDWEVESGNMAAIYQNTYLVIGADMSSNSNGGFLDVQSGGYHGHGWPIAAVNNNIIYARSEHIGVYDFEDGHPLGHEPLSTRAWTLQEQILSSRMVHFASKEMVWECKSAIRCECMQLDRKAEFHQPPLSLRNLTSNSGSVFRKWYHLVDEVVERSLTKSQDLLPCLSGIARYYQDNGAGAYLAGLWSEDLLVGLTWSSEEPPDRCSRAVPYRGPSWSWTSLDRVSYPYGRPISYGKSGDRFKKAYTKVIEATCVPSGKDSLGAVSDGRLRVVGPLLKMEEGAYINPQYDSDDFPDESLFFLFIGEFYCLHLRGDVRGLVLRQQCFSTSTFERVGWFELHEGCATDLLRGIEDSEITIV